MGDRILSFLSKLDTDGKASAIDIDTDLFETGVLDSFGFVELVGFLEKETGQSVTEEDMDDPRFTTIAGILEVLTTNAKVEAAGGAR